MTDVLDPLIIPLAYQDTDSSLVESFNIPGSALWVLGAALSPVSYPDGANLIPKGAGFYGAVDAPTAGVAITDGGLNDNGAYSWAVTVVTHWGESNPSNLLTLPGIGAGKHGQTLNLPTFTERPDNPVVSRRIYRTIDGDVVLNLVVEIEDLSVGVYIDEVPDSELATTAPSSDTTGYFGSVDIWDGSSHWTEKSNGDSLDTQEFSVDYTTLASGGTVFFSGLDIGTAVTATYNAGTFLGSVFLNQYQTALAALHSFLRTNTTAEFPHNVKIDGNLEVDGSSTLASLHVTGTSALDGAVTAGTTLHVVGATSLSSTLDLTGAATLHATLDLTGAATLHATLHVVGVSTLDGLITGNAGLTITADGIDVTGNSTFHNDLLVDGTLSIATGGLLKVLGINNMEVANIFGPGGTTGTPNTTVTIGHASGPTNPVDLGVTGTLRAIVDAHIGGVLQVDNIQGNTSPTTDVTFAHSIVVTDNAIVSTGSVELRRLLVNQGTGPTFTTWNGTNTVATASRLGTAAPKDMFGVVDYTTDGGSQQSGYQFTVTYGGASRATYPGVFVNYFNTDTTSLTTLSERAWAATSTDLSFDVWFNFVPAPGTTYTITWLVVN